MKLHDYDGIGFSHVLFVKPSFLFLIQRLIDLQRKKTKQRKEKEIGGPNG